MATIFTRIRLLIAAIALVVLAAAAAPVAAQQPNSVDPNAAAVKEQQLLQHSLRIQGLGTIPDTKSYVIEQPGHWPYVSTYRYGSYDTAIRAAIADVSSSGWQPCDIEVKPAP